MPDLSVTNRNDLKCSYGSIKFMCKLTGLYWVSIYDGLGQFELTNGL